jgi:hypothetical protein
MSDFVLGEQIEKHEDTLEAMGKALTEGKPEEFVAEATGLVTALASGQPLLGALVKHGFAHIFGASANAVLEKQIAAWNQELDRQQHIARLAEAIEVLLGQALIQVVRAQHGVKDELLQALGGVRADLAGFREDFGARMAAAQAELRIEQDLVGEGATGVRVRASSSQSVLVRQGTVTGAGTTGVEIG